MVSKFAKKKITPWKISRLKPHPRQSVFRPHIQQEIADVADSLAREGLICPVEITPDGFIICGHGRIASAKHLGWDTIHVWVRADLAGEGEDAVFQRLIEDNLRRRPLSKLGLGRAYRALKKQEYDSWRRKDQEEVRGDFRDYLGEVLGCDGTTAERWARLAELPSAYDQLIESNLVTQQQAAKIVKCLPADIRERLGKKLADIAAKDLDRKVKKQEIRAAVDARLGKRADKPRRHKDTWHHSLPPALNKLSQDIPAPIAGFVDQLEAAESVQAVLRLLTRKYPDATRALADAEFDFDAIDEDQLKRSALVILGVLQGMGSRSS